MKYLLFLLIPFLSHAQTFPTPPQTGRYALVSINGILSWSRVTSYPVEADSTNMTKPVTLLTYTADPNHDEIIEVCGNLQVAKVQTTPVQWYCAFQNEYGVKLGIAPTAISFAGSSQFPPVQQRIKAGSTVTISVKAVGAIVGSMLYSAGAYVRFVRWAN